MKKILFAGMILLGALSACNSQSDKDEEEKDAPRAQNDSSVMVDFDNKTDSELLLDGYFKIKSTDSLSVLLRDKSILQLVDFTDYDSSLASEYKRQLNQRVDSLQFFMTILAHKKPQITIRHVQDGGEYGIIKEIYSLFPKPWFSSFTHDSARIKNELTIINMRLGKRGTYFKINHHNDVLPTSFNASNYITSVLTDNNALDLSVWCPPLGQALSLKKKEIADLVLNMAKSSKPQALSQFALFTDSTTLVCLSFNKETVVSGEKMASRPVLELFFTLRDNNPLVIVSNGYGYAAFRYENIAPLKNHLRQYIE